jgi:hypothetical protein
MRDIIRFRVAGSMPAFSIPSTIPVPAPPRGRPYRCPRGGAHGDRGRRGRPDRGAAERSGIGQRGHRPAENELVGMLGNREPDGRHAPDPPALVQFRVVNRQPFDVDAYMEDVFGVTELTSEEVETVTGSFPSPHDHLTGPSVGPAGDRARVEGHRPGAPRHGDEDPRPVRARRRNRIPFRAKRLGSFTGRYVWHCHSLDHEDNEMMLPYEVVP